MVKFLVDTSVWIDFFRGHLPPLLLDNLGEGLRLRLVVITDVIRHEIRVGARNPKDYRELTALLNPLTSCSLTPEDQESFDLFAWELQQKGMKGKYTDASIAYLAVKHSMPILSFDRYFQRLARRGILRAISF